MQPMILKMLDTAKVQRSSCKAFALVNLTHPPLSSQNLKFPLRGKPLSTLRSSWT
ncbi:hypothetical protein Golax_000638 [Gossypium laxum]|uniref:Uncharacterized protein n=1 Tax=Gossypium laxum TaxID=34288 RepID=A0A7J9AW48_9ROSI|nr:hypothetical protein [Gossypium laxum]